MIDIQCYHGQNKLKQVFIFIYIYIVLRIFYFSEFFFSRLQMWNNDCRCENKQENSSEENLCFREWMLPKCRVARSIREGV